MARRIRLVLLHELRTPLIQGDTATKCHPFGWPCNAGEGCGFGSPWNVRQTNPPITRRITNTTANVKAVLLPPALRAVCMSLKMSLQENGAPRRRKGEIPARRSADGTSASALAAQ